MDFLSVFTTPQRPKLKFGEPLNDVCKNDTLHPSLQDLFLKAYLNVIKSVDDQTEAVLQALRGGQNGQGSLSQRISLMDKFEMGEWIVGVSTPPGAPIWLLRHFLGRLPQPLLKGSQWKVVSDACGASNFSSKARIVKLVETIVVFAKQLEKVEYEILALLALTIRKLTWEKDCIGDEAVEALSLYFIGSIVARPFRPGLNTPVDKQCQPLLVFLSKYWYEIFQGSTIKDHDNESRCDYFKHENENPRYIGFESLLIERNGQFEESPTTSCNADDCLRKKNNVIDDLNVIECDVAAVSPSSSSRDTLVQRKIIPSFHDDFDNVKMSIEKIQMLDKELANDELIVEKNVCNNSCAETKSNISDKDIKAAASASSIIKEDEEADHDDSTSEKKKEDQENCYTEETDSFEDAVLFGHFHMELIKRFENCKSTAVNSSRAAGEFFSVQNSEDSL